MTHAIIPCDWCAPPQMGQVAVLLFLIAHQFIGLLKVLGSYSIIQSYSLERTSLSVLVCFSNIYRSQLFHYEIVIDRSALTWSVSVMEAKPREYLQSVTSRSNSGLREPDNISMLLPKPFQKYLNVNADNSMPNSNLNLLSVLDVSYNLSLNIYVHLYFCV